MFAMTLEHYRERVAPVVQRPVALRRAAWLDPHLLAWSLQDPGVLDAGACAFKLLRDEHPEPE
jgi:hypothetical protein